MNLIKNKKHILWAFFLSSALWGMLVFVTVKNHLMSDGAARLGLLIDFIVIEHNSISGEYVFFWDGKGIVLNGLLITGLSIVLSFLFNKTRKK